MSNHRAPSDYRRRIARAFAWFDKAYAACENDTQKARVADKLVEDIRKHNQYKPEKTVVESRHECL